jgi:predicted PurR-regulated permease PerM
MTSLFLIGGISLILNVIFIIGIRNLIKQNEEYEDIVVNTKLEILAKIEIALQQMRDIDNREVFEKDDEVGATFQQLKNIIEDLNNEI